MSALCRNLEKHQIHQPVLSHLFPTLSLCLRVRVRVRVGVCVCVCVCRVSSPANLKLRTTCKTLSLLNSQTLKRLDIRVGMFPRMLTVLSTESSIMGGTLIPPSPPKL